MTELGYTIVWGEGQPKHREGEHIYPVVDMFDELEKDVRAMQKLGWSCVGGATLLTEFSTARSAGSRKVYQTMVKGSGDSPCRYKEPSFDKGHS